MPFMSEIYKGFEVWIDNDKTGRDRVIAIHQGTMLSFTTFTFDTSTIDKIRHWIDTLIKWRLPAARRKENV